MIAAIFLILLALYCTAGICFAIPFTILGVGKIDPHATHGSWGFRLLIIPGAMALWPFLLKRLVNGTTSPPEEQTAHRRVAKRISK